MKLIVNINELKSLTNLTIELPVKRGIYAITGQNASGKSTLVAATATAFYNAPMNKYFGKTVTNGTVISFSLGAQKKKWEFNRRWMQSGNLKLKGFFEGSIIFGNRFKETSFNTIDKIEKINKKDIIEGDIFVRKNLGSILHNNESFYEKLYTVKDKIAYSKYKLLGVPYFYEKDGKVISQYYMSTGENLLITILHSILLRINDRRELNTPCLLLLDEIELALHPSSLSRLLSFLKRIAQKYNMAIYFSTHSIELIREVAPENIFFLDRMIDNSIMVVNPCYPSYATKILYDHCGYDTIILVEDELAKIIVDRLLRGLRLLDNKLVHVMPCGGWQNVLKLAHDVVDSNLFSKPSRLLIILDGDIERQVPSFVSKYNLKIRENISFLPLQSLEKFLKRYLFEAVNHQLFQFLDNYLFQQISLKSILEEYKKNNEHRDDKNGKKLYKRIQNELDNRDKSKFDLIELVVDFMFDHKLENIERTEKILIKELR